MRRKAMTMNDDEFNKDMIGLIEKNLPKAATDAVLNRIRMVEKLERELEAREKLLKQREGEVVRLTKEVGEWESKRNDLNAREAGIRHSELALDNKAERLSEQERNLTIEMLKKDVECEKAQKVFCQETTKLLVRNTDYRQSITGQQAVPIATSYYKDGASSYPTGGNTGVPGVSIVDTRQVVQTTKE
jgi:hypothetical protein